MQRYVKNSAVAALLYVCMATAQAANWKLVGESSTAKVYLDLQSVRFSGSNAKAWFLFDYSAPREVPVSYPTKTYQSVKQLNQFDCASGTSGVAQSLSFAGTAGEGEVVDSQSIQPTRVSYSDVVPDSVGETMLNRVCSMKKAAKSM
jgi:hypothetical protein